MTKEPNRIELVFSELKSRGLIPPERKLRPSGIVPNFRSALFFNTTSYNPKFCDMQEDTIRFSLLHEEGHKILPQYGLPRAMLFFIIALIPLLFIFIFYHNTPVSADNNFVPVDNKSVLVISSLFYTLILGFSTLATFRESFHGDELNADLYAAEILRDSYGVKKPSYVLYNTLIELDSIMYPEHSEKASLLYQLQYGLLPLHPPIAGRVKNVARFVDCY